MRMPLILMLSALSINLTACQTTTHPVIPEHGPSMEQVYDSLSPENAEKEKGNEKTLPTIRANLTTEKLRRSTLPNTVNARAIDKEFHKLPNPELKMYVFPHLSGQEEMPVPGYTTAIEAYNQDHYTLSSETFTK